MKTKEAWVPIMKRAVIMALEGEFIHDGQEVEGRVLVHGSEGGMGIEIVIGDIGSEPTQWGWLTIILD